VGKERTINMTLVPIPKAQSRVHVMSSGWDTSRVGKVKIGLPELLVVFQRKGKPVPKPHRRRISTDVTGIPPSREFRLSVQQPCQRPPL